MRKTINVSETTLNRIKKLGILGETHEDVVKRALDCLEQSKGGSE